MSGVAAGILKFKGLVEKIDPLENVLDDTIIETVSGVKKEEEKENG